MKKIIAVCLSIALAFVIPTTIPHTSAASEEVAFCDWSGKIFDAKTEGWTSPHNQNVKNLTSAITVTDGVMSYNTKGFTYDCAHVQMSCALDETAVRNAIAAAKATDNQLYVTISLKRARSTYSTTSVGFKMYCYANGNWQDAIDIIDGSKKIEVRGSQTYMFDVNKLKGLIPDTIAINAANYDTGITDLNYTVSSVTAGGEKATFTTTDNSELLQKKKYEDYGNLIDHHILGDMNHDDVLNVMDIRSLVNELLSGNISNDADVNENGERNIIDAQTQMKMISDALPITHRPVTTDGAINYNAIHPTNEKGNYVINGKEYKRIFNDDFEGNSFDRTKWNYCPQQSRCGGQDVWKNDMVSMDGKGDIVLSCALDEDDTSRAKSGAIRTRDKFYSSYGYYECRVLLQQYSPNFWGAFWIMPNVIDDGHNGGSDGTEIDIFESAYRNSNKVQQGVHYDGYESRHKTVGQSSYFDDLYDGYHTIGFSWEKDCYKFYIDGQLSYQLNEGDNAGGIPLEICEIEEYLKLTVESASYWGGLFDPSKTPNNIDGITVDYVRVYEEVE